MHDGLNAGRAYVEQMRSHGQSDRDTVRGLLTAGWSYDLIWQLSATLSVPLVDGAVRRVAVVDTQKRERAAVEYTPDISGVDLFDEAGMTRGALTLVMTAHPRSIRCERRMRLSDRPTDGRA